MTHYTEDVQRIVRLTKCPYRGFIVDYVDHADYLELRVYKDNIEEYSEPQKVALSEYLFRLREAIRLTGTKCHIQGSESPVPYPNWEGKN